MTEAVEEADESPGLPIGPRDRALMIAAGTASGIVGFWIGVTSVPESVLITPTGVIPINRSAVGGVVLFALLGAFVAFQQWDLSRGDDETEGSDA